MSAFALTLFSYFIQFFLMQLRFTFSLLLGLLLGTCVRAQTDLATQLLITLNYSGTYEEYTIPSQADGGVFDFFLRGSDGGSAQAGSCTQPGGEGAEVKASLFIGNDANELKPGATVRFIVAREGISKDNAPSAHASGGSSTALLYTEGDPNSIGETTFSEDILDAPDHWVILGVAGGGGGAHQGVLVGCTDNYSGDNANASTGGTRGNGGGGGNGGNNGNGGNEGDRGGVGGGGVYGSGAGFSEARGRSGNARGTFTYNNGNSNSTRFNYGFTTGANGLGGSGAGGGGGYSGGGGSGLYLSGGGGGSFLNSAVFNGEKRTRNSRNIDVDNGLATYQIRSNLPLFAFCQKSFTVSTPYDGDFTLDPAILDDGSFDQDGSFLDFSFAADFDPCTDLQEGSNEVTLIVTDLDGNTDQCISTVVVETTTAGVATMSSAETLPFTGSYQDLHIPTDPDAESIVLRVNGGDGGRARIRSGLFCDNDIKRGGGGAIVQATFPVGFADNTLQPGGLLRFIVGERGGSHTVDCGTDVTYGGGGGGTAILYKASSRCAWEILMAAGGGGGGQNTDGLLETYNGEDGRPLADGANESSGGNGNSSNNANGGTGGNGGNVNSQLFDSDEGGAGGGAFTDGEDGGCGLVDGGGGKAGGTTGGEGGSSLSTCDSRTGGFGFGGGGRGMQKGGGGGGYNGGTDEGGGGGSFITSDYSWNNRISEVEEYADNQPEDGYASYEIISGATIATITPICPDVVINTTETLLEFRPTEFIDNEDDYQSVAYADGTFYRAFDCTDFRTPNVTLSIVDKYGRSLSCTPDVTINDVQIPVLDCDDIFVTLEDATMTANGQASIDILSLATATDNCTTLLTTASRTSFDCADAGQTIPVTITATDGRGNSSDCTINVVVDVPELGICCPDAVAVCPDTTVYLDEAGNLPTLEIFDLISASTFTCDMRATVLDSINLACQPATFDTYSVSLADTLDATNLSICTGTITIQDTFPPVITCIADTTIFLDENGTASLSRASLITGLTDNCGISATSELEVLNFDCAASATDASVNVTVTDFGGNEVSCSVAVLVQDTIVPKLVCRDTAVYLGASTISTEALIVSATDNCPLTFTGGESIAAPDCDDIGNQVNANITISDPEGNSASCSFLVTIQDVTAPSVTCPDDITTIADPGSCEATVSWDTDVLALTDNCDPTTNIPGYTFITLQNGSYYFRSNSRITAEDISDEQDYLSTFGGGVVTVNDATENDLIATIADDISTLGVLIGYTDEATEGIFEWLNGGGTGYTNWANSQPDNDNLSFGENYTNVAPNGTWSDIVGSLTRFVIAEVPEGAIPSNLIVTTTAESGASFPVGTTAVTYAVTDPSGNVGSCSFNVTVNDEEAPVFDCPADMTIVASDCDGATVNYLFPTASDNCDNGLPLTLTAGLGSGAFFPIGATMEAYSTTDAAGNAANCSFLVRVTSNEAPIILNCPQDVTFVSLPGECGAAISWLEPSVDVDCDVSNTFSFSDDFDPIQATNWSSIEGGAESTFCGSVSGNAFRFTGDDENGGQRLLTTQPLNVTSSGTISFYLLISAGGPDFQQNCDRAEAGEGVELQYSTDGGASWVTITYYGTLEDGPQNTPHLSNFDLKTEVIPDAALSPATQFRLIQPEFSGGGFDVWAIDDFNVTYTAGTSFQQTAGKANGEYVDPGSYDIEYVALNAGGAATTCAFTVTVEDRESPVMDNCPDNITVDADMGSCEAIVSWTDPISTEENCLFDPPLADVLGRYASNLDGVLAVIPNRFVLQYEVNNNNGFRGGGEDTYAYGNLISTSFGSNLEYTQGAIVTSSAFGEEGAYFTSYSNGVWMLVADLDEVSSYRINGNLGTDGDGTANDYSTTFTAVDGTVYYAFFKRVFGTGKPSVNHLILVPYGSLVEQVITDNTNQDLHRISQLATARRIYQFNFYGDRDVDDGYAYTDAEVDVIIEAFVDLVVGTVNLPEITRTAGLANGTSFPVGLTEVTYTATDDAGNTSSCSFNVTVTDNIPPTIFNSTDGSNCTGDLLVELNAAGNLVIPNLINDLVAEDNCGAILSQSPAIGVEIPNLATGDTEVVSITATDYASNTNTESCAVTLTVIAVLPLDLLSFTGEARHKINLLAWTTANEEDFNHFEVERSPDGNAWNFIGEVPRSSPREGPGERAYVFEDEGISAYYRLKMVDLDGTFTYSDVVFLENNAGATAGAIRVYPNPSNGRFSVDLSEVLLPAIGEGELRLVDLHGRRVWTRKISNGQPTLPVDLSYSRAGVYLLTLLTNNGQSFTQRIVIH